MHASNTVITKELPIKAYAQMKYLSEKEVRKLIVLGKVEAHVVDGRYLVKDKLASMQH